MSKGVQHGELVYGLVIVVDIENFSDLNTLDQALVQSRLSQVLDQAADQAHLDRDQWYRQLRGDGELAVLPPHTDAAWVVADFTDQLAASLAQLRDAGAGGPSPRLRIAMHHGTLTAGHFGPVGRAPIVACRLVDATILRRALAAEPASDLVLAVSRTLYHDVVETRFHGLDPNRFRAMQVSVKGVTHMGYLCVGTPRAAGYQRETTGAALSR